MLCTSVFFSVLFLGSSAHDAAPSPTPSGVSSSEMLRREQGQRSAAAVLADASSAQMGEGKANTVLVRRTGQEPGISGSDAGAFSAVICPSKKDECMASRKCEWKGNSCVHKACAKMAQVACTSVSWCSWSAAGCIGMQSASSLVASSKVVANANSSSSSSRGQAKQTTSCNYGAQEDCMNARNCGWNTNQAQCMACTDLDAADCILQTTCAVTGEPPACTGAPAQENPQSGSSVLSVQQSRLSLVPAPCGYDDLASCRDASAGCVWAPKKKPKSPCMLCSEVDNTHCINTTVCSISGKSCKKPGTPSTSSALQGGGIQPPSSVAADSHPELAGSLATTHVNGTDVDDGESSITPPPPWYHQGHMPGPADLRFEYQASIGRDGYEPDPLRPASEFFGPFRLDYRHHAVIMDNWNFAIKTDIKRVGEGNLIVGEKNKWHRAANSVLLGTNNFARGEYAFVAGKNNVANGVGTTVTGGEDNDATGHQNSVSGGTKNYAKGAFSTILGGHGNKATGEYSDITGGLHGTASGKTSTVTGGWRNQAMGLHTAVNGGGNNTVPEANNSAAVDGGSSVGWPAPTARPGLDVPAGAVEQDMPPCAQGDPCLQVVQDEIKANSRRGKKERALKARGPIHESAAHSRRRSFNGEEPHDSSSSSSMLADPNW